MSKKPTKKYLRYGFDETYDFDKILSESKNFNRFNKADLIRYYKAMQGVANRRLNETRDFNTRAVQKVAKKVKKFGNRDIQKFKFKLDKKLTFPQIKREFSIMYNFLMSYSGKKSWVNKNLRKMSERIKPNGEIMTVPESQVEFDVYRRLSELQPLIESRYLESDSILEYTNIVINEDEYNSYFKAFSQTMPIGSDIRKSKEYEAYIELIAQNLKEILESPWQESISQYQEALEEAKRQGVKGIGNKVTFTKEQIEEIRNRERPDKII